MWHHFQKNVTKFLGIFHFVNLSSKKYKKHKIRTLTHCLYLLSHYLHSCKEFIDKEKRIKSEFILRSMNSLNFLLQYPHNFTSSHLWDWIFPFDTIFLVCAVASLWKKMLGCGGKESKSNLKSMQISFLNLSLFLAYSPNPAPNV